MAARDSLRVDRWLWCARFFKTRNVAGDAVRGGHVRVNGERVKPAREVKPGDVVRIVRGLYEFHITVTAIPSRRGPASEAKALYEERPQSIERREARAARRREAAKAPTERRPDKRTRRLIRSRRGRY